MFHLNMLELILSQSSPQGSSFGLDRFRNDPSVEPSAASVDWLSSSINAVRSLISVLLVLPPGEEAAMSNIGWIMIYCGLSLAVRLDLTVANGNLSGSTSHLRRFLDMHHTLRQIVLRLEAASASELNTSSDGRSSFQDLLRRILRLEKWYLDQVGMLPVHTPPGIQVAEPTPPATIGSCPTTGSCPNSGSVGNTPAGSMMSQDAWSETATNTTNWYQVPEFDMGSFLFTDPANEFAGYYGP